MIIPKREIQKVLLRGRGDLVAVGMYCTVQKKKKKIAVRIQYSLQG